MTWNIFATPQKESLQAITQNTFLLCPKSLQVLELIPKTIHSNRMDYLVKRHNLH